MEEVPIQTIFIPVQSPLSSVVQRAYESENQKTATLSCAKKLDMVELQLCPIFVSSETVAAVKNFLTATQHFCLFNFEGRGNYAV
jgi:hypothetical protein